MFQKHKVIRWFFNRFYRVRMPEMVRYWQNGDTARAKLVTINGAYAMVIEGEKYPLWGFPRGPVLYGPLARLKNVAKNLVFNATWKLLEDKRPDKEIEEYLFGLAFPMVIEEIKKIKYDMFPPDKLCPAVQELWRAMTVVEKQIPDLAVREDIKTLKEGFTFFLQEDDAYRFRFQWAAKYINPKNPLRRLYYLLKRKKYSFKDELKLVFSFLGHAEITPDMKGRAVLIQRILLFLLDKADFGEFVERVMKEINWKKLYLSKADKYYLRGKYFKCDLESFDY